MTMPTGPFPRVEDDPTMFDRTLRRGRRRRLRTASLISAALLTLVGTAAVTLTRAGQTEHRITTDVSQEEPIADFDPSFNRGVASEQLTAMATDCPSPCGVIVRIGYTGGRVLAAVGSVDAGDQAKGHISSFVLARGTTKLDEVHDSSAAVVMSQVFGGFHGVAVLSGTDGASTVYVPVVVRGDSIDLTNGGFSHPQITSDIAFGDVIDPVLFDTKILSAHKHNRKWDYTRWSWTGSSWQGDTCQPDFNKLTSDNGDVPCFARHYPDQPSWVSDVGCGHDNCWVDGPVTLPNGDKLAALYSDGPNKLVLMRNGVVLDTLPDGRFSGGLPKDLVVDDTGHALLRLTDHEEKSSWVLPLGEVGDKLTVLQGGYESGHALAGNEGTQIQDLNGDGTDEVLTTNDGATTTYHWDGTHYAAAGPAESPWTRQVDGCTSLCVEIGHVALAGGETLSVLNGQVQGRFKVVLRKGDQVLDALPVRGFADGYAADVAGDGSGRVLLRVGGGATASWVQPFATAGNALTLIQGSFDSADMRGDNNTEVKDVNGDGLLDVLVTMHKYATATEPYKQSTTTWQWNGTRYAPTGCTGALC
jgi:hypothetical protein